MDGESGYEGGSEASSAISSHSDCKEKKPCEICGSNSNAHEIMICFRCQETREHTYCARVNLPSVPPMWLCEVCRRPNSSNVVDLATNPRTNDQVEEEAVGSEDSTETVDQNAPPRTNQVVNNEAGPSSSRTNQVEQAVGNASDESSSPES